MNQGQPEFEVGMSRDANVLDDAFKVIWEKARAAGDLVNRLRDEKQMVSDRLRDFEVAFAEKLKSLEKEIAALRSDLLTKEQNLKRLRAEHSQLLSANGHHSFSEEEREILKSRIRDLVAKINSYL